MAVPVDVPQGSGGPVPDPGVPAAGGKAIEGRSPGRIAWVRFRHDKVAMAGGIIVLLLILGAIIGPFLVQNPNTYHSNLINPTFSRPNGPLGGISLAHPLGVEPVTGRDMLARGVNGARYSLLIGFFAIALVGVIPNTAFGLSGNGLRVVLLIFVIGFFAWPYMGRIVRGQILSLREREFVAAARSMGARSPYILVRELLPNLVAPILVYSTLLIPTNILFEAVLHYLGVGLIPPTSSWGQMLSNAVTNGFYYIDPMFMIIPGVAIFITVMAFNLFGDGLRDALDPRSRKPPVLGPEGTIKRRGFQARRGS